MSERWFIINPGLPALLSVGIIFTLSLFFLWLELKKQTRLLLVRIVVLIIMMASLCAILLRPYRKTHHSDSIVVLTPGYNPKQVDSLFTLDPELKIINAPGAKSYKNSLALHSYHNLTDFREDVDFVLGQGLPTDALDIIEPVTYHFLPSKYPSGIIQLMVPEIIYPNRINTIEGIVNNSSASTTLLLESPGSIEDSVIISVKNYQPFKLAFTPKSAGNFLYTIKVRDDSGKELIEMLPIHVQTRQRSNILFIQNYPTFETQYLKNFLARHHNMLLRYRLSKRTFRYESINHKLQRIERLTNSSLRLFDLILIDSDALKALSLVEIKDLHNAVKRGLGVIIIFNDQPQRIPQIKSFLPLDFKTFFADTAHVNLSDSKKILSSWPVQAEADRFIHPVSKNKNRILSGYCYEGFGKVGFQLLQETYRLVLEGDSISYSTLWSGLIEKTARTTKSKFNIRIKNRFPIFQDDPITVEIISSGQQPNLVNDSINIPVKEDILVDDVWYAKTWAGKPGWHLLKISDDSIQFRYYISEPGVWKSLMVANTIRQTTLSSASVIKEKRLREVVEPISPIIFYVAFLLSAGLLWLIPKL